MERLEEPSAPQFIWNEHSLPKEEDASVSECALSRTAVHVSLVLLKIKIYFYEINTVSALGKYLSFQFFLRWVQLVLEFHTGQNGNRDKSGPLNTTHWTLDSAVSG